VRASARGQAFHYIASKHFHHKAGELNFSNHVLSGDTNGDGKADFQIHVLNVDTIIKGIDIHL
jgi:serralysin